MPIKIDTTQVREGASDFAPIEAGIYDASVYDIQLTKVKSGKNEGAPMLTWTYQLQGEGVQNRRLWNNYMLTPNATWKLVQDLCAAFGYKPEQFEGDSFDFEPRDVVGSRCQLKVSVGQWNGKPTNNVDEVYAEGTHEEVGSAATSRSGW